MKFDISFLLQIYEIVLFKKGNYVRKRINYPTTT